ncbi:MAG: DUF444 family protein [Proteobacteria bacterium]|nr:DUF444 family protein [Pseudomonadota bacterium]
MYTKMDSDLSRFRKIVRGQVRKELKNFISSGDIITQIPSQGNRKSQTLSIPLPQINLPKFTHGPNNNNQQKGVAQGKGDVGKDVASSDEPGGQASQSPADHAYESEVTLDELGQLLGEELNLPRIEQKGNKTFEQKHRRYSGVLNQGPESLHHFTRTYRSALKRSIASGIYDPKNPVVVPIKDDKKYRSFQAVNQPLGSAVMIYMMDVSGSMGDKQKELVRLTSFWLDTWLTHSYKGVERRFIIHDATAKVVAEDLFYRTRESGGTLISSAYKKAIDLINNEFPPQDWNIYLFHFSDGDNWSQNDTQLCLQLLDSSILPAANLFCYGQTESRYGSGYFLKDLTKHYQLPASGKVVASQISDQGSIIPALKTFLGSGR